jgi:hypothetical protein
MMASITIDLDGNAAEQLQELDNELSTTSGEVQELTTSTAKLAKVQEHQVTVIEQQRGSYVTLAAETAGLVKESVKLVRMFGELAYGAELTAMRLTEYAGKALIDAIETTAKFAVGAIGVTAAIKAWRGETDRNKASQDDLTQSTAELTDRQMALAKSIGLSVAANVAGLGPALAAARVSTWAYAELLSRTGERIDELGNKTNNLDRLREASAGLKSDLAAVGSEVGTVLKGMAVAATPLLRVIGEQGPKAWKAMDEAVTRHNDRMIENINLLRDAVIGTRELEAANAKLEAQREKEKSGFEAIRNVNATFAEQQKERARAAEIASIKTVEGIEREIQATRERSAREAQAGQDAEAIGRRLLTDLNALENQRTKIHEEEVAKQTASDQRASQLRKSYDENYTKFVEGQQQIRVKAMQAEYDREKERLDDLAAYRRQVAADRRSELISDFEATIKARAEQQKAAVEGLKTDAKVAAQRKIDRDTEEALHALKVRRIKNEANEAIEAAKTESEQRKAAIEGTRKLEAAEAEFRRRQKVQQIEDETAAARRSVEIEKDKQAKLKAAREEALDKAGIKGEDLLKGADRRDVLANVREQARRQAESRTREYSGFLLKGAPSDENREKYARLQRQAQEKAMDEAQRDFMKGKTDPQQLAQAQAQAAQKQLVTAQSQGKLSADVVQTLTMAIRTSAEQQATTEALQKQVADLQKAAGVVGQRAQQTRKQGQGGSLF